MKRIFRAGWVAPERRSAVVLLLTLAAVLIPLQYHTFNRTGTPALFLTASAEEGDSLAISQQEILNALRWGIERNRSPEDIQRDIDGINQAYGGSGRVPLPMEIQSVQTRSGRATLTAREANNYEAASAGLARQTPPDTSGLSALRADSARWAGWQQADAIRAVAAAAGLTSLQSEFDSEIADLDSEIETIEQEPTRADYGPAYEQYGTYAEAMEAWNNRAEMRDRAIATRNEAIENFEDRLRRMVDPNEEDLDFTSMANRPTVRMRQIGREMDSLRNAMATYQDSVGYYDRWMQAIEFRTTGRSWSWDLLGSRGDAPLEWGERSGDGSVDDLLKEFGADGDGGGGSAQPADSDSGGRTVLANEELLAGIQRRFDGAAYDLERCAADFDAQLAALSGQPTEVVCSDARLASAYACIEDQYYYTSGYYDDAHARISEADPQINWAEMQMETDLYDAGQTRISPMDQITITLINTKFDQVSNAVTGARSKLAAQAPGCDPEDLRRAGSVTTSGDGGDGGGNGGSGSGDGGGTGGGEVEEGVHFRKLMAPQVQGSEQPARCEGGTLTLKRTSMPSFPDEIWPGQTYTVEIGLSWQTQGNAVEAVDVSVSAFFMDPSNVKIEEYNALSADGFVPFKFGTSGVDFSRPGGVITISYGGRVDTEKSTASTGGTVIVQSYERVGN